MGLCRCREHGVGILAHSVLGKGLCTGKHAADHVFPDDDERSSVAVDATVIPLHSLQWGFQRGWRGAASRTAELSPDGCSQGGYAKDFSGPRWTEFCAATDKLKARCAALPLRFHCRFIAVSLLFHCCSTAFLLRFCCVSTAVSLLFHCCSTAVWLTDKLKARCCCLLPD